MTLSPARIAGRLERLMSEHLPERRDDSGLTTLEWLLIVAAVAGLAALAVVLVQNVVSDTGEQIAGTNARKIAAQVAAQEVMRQADSDTQPDGADTFVEWIPYYSTRCERIRITYADIEGLQVSANFVTNAIPGGDAAMVSASLVETGNVTAGTNTVAESGKAIAECRVS